MKRGQGEWCFNQRKDGTWTARKQFGRKENGKPNIVAFYDKTLAAVRRKAKEYEHTLEEGLEDLSTLTLYNYIRSWLTEYKQNSVKATTYDGMEVALNVRIKPYSIANIQLCNLNTRICQQYINNLTTTSQKYSRATIIKTYNLINQCMKHAVQMRDITKNPMEYVKIPAEDIVQTKEVATKFFTSKQADQIKQKSLERDYKNNLKHKYGPVIVLLMYTGLRIGECLALKWGDVDFSTEELKISKNLATIKDRSDSSRKTKVVETTAKTKKSCRIVPISKTAKDMLLLLKELAPYTPTSTDYVVMTSKGTSPTRRNIARAWDTILAECNFDITNDKEGYGLHSLRHTFVSMLLEKKVDIKIISELVGHRKVSTTYDIYAHLIPSQKHLSVKLLDSDK